jgi:hypothetical protein
MKKKMTWLRLHNTVADDPKVQQLPAPMFKDWVNLLCIACRYGGALPDTKSIAFTLRCSEEDAEQRVRALIQAKLVDEVDGQRCMHDWSWWQFEGTSTARVRKHRERKRSETVPCNEGETPQIQKQSTEPDTEPDTEPHSESESQSDTESDQNQTATALDSKYFRRNETNSHPATPLEHDESAEEQFWKLAPEASSKGISQARVSKLLDGCEDYEEALAVLRRAMKARLPGAYISKVIREKAAEQAIDGAIIAPEVVCDARREGYDVKRHVIAGNATIWEVGGDFYDQWGESIDDDDPRHPNHPHHKSLSTRAVTPPISQESGASH